MNALTERLRALADEYKNARHQEDEYPAIDELREAAYEIEKLRDILETLMDEQNGPPLIRDAKRWHAVMERASEAVGRIEAAKFHGEKARTESHAR